MPLSRYTIRNEYSLADPELFRAADKDDPEALLEGVAMAGLVGVLRQLGDLAEFAAEIFHDLHEELMVTAARGHGLTVRVQQIEAEFPKIEKAFLAQTSHSSFYYNSGVDWHPNVHLDQNLVTQGDLPRFVMDSYEECRGPPRLFLLDKFDVAGAGSCLKRYTDPSFFKAESPSSVLSNAAVQREKKSRKSKKKGLRWRNGETPEATSHVKLQQLLLEERVENHISDPARRVKLKRRLNGSPSGSTMRKSYMDTFLKNPTPDPEVVREISITRSPLKILSSVAGETGNKTLDIATLSSDKNTQSRKRSTHTSDSEAGHKPFLHEMTEEDYGSSPKFCSTQMDDVQSTLHEVDKKEIAAEGVRKMDGYQSDEEVDNYVDALTSMDSEMETDSEYRAKNNMRLMNVNGQRIGSDATEELYDIQTHSTDTQSMGNSSLMDGGNSSSRKGKSSFSYSGSFDLAENAASEGDASAKIIPSPEHCDPEIVNSSDQYSFNGTPSTQATRNIIEDNTGKENAIISTYNNESEEPSSSSCLTESGTVLLPGDAGEQFMEVSSLGPKLHEISSNNSYCKSGYVKDEENSIHLDIPCTSSSDDRPSQTRDAGFSEVFSLNLSSDLHLASDNGSNEDLRNVTVQGEYQEREHALDSVASPVQSLTTFASQKEELDKPENESFCPNVKPEANTSKTASRCCPSSETGDHVEMQLQKPENDHPPDSGLDFCHIPVVKLDGVSSMEAYKAEIGGLTSDIDDIDYEKKENIILQAKDVVNAVADNLNDNEDDTTSLDSRCMRLLGECSVVTRDLHQNGVKLNEEHIYESPVEEMANEQVDDSLELETISSKTLHCGHSDLDLLHHVAGTSTGESLSNSLHVDKDDAVMPLYQDSEDAEAISLQKIHVIEKEEDTPCSPTHNLAEISTSQILQAELYNGQFDAEPWHDLVSGSKSTYHTVIEDAEDVLSSPTNHLLELSIPLDQKVESLNGSLNIKSCHATHDQVPELSYSHRTDALEEEYISSPRHHAVELRIPPKENFELQKHLFDSESPHDHISQSTSALHISFIENAEDSIYSPSHHKYKPRASVEQNDESLGNKFAVAPRQQQDSYSKPFQHMKASEKAEDAASLSTSLATELKPPTEQKVAFQNNQFDVRSWHDQFSTSEHAQQIEVTESSEMVASVDIPELTTPIDQTLKLQDENSIPTNNKSTDPHSLMQGESSTPNNQDRESYPSSDIPVVDLPSQTPSSQFSPQFSVSKPAEDPLESKLPTSDLLSEASLDGIAPLPLLPPVQWRLEKLQPIFPAPEGNLFGHKLQCLPLLVSTTEDKSQSDHVATEAEKNYPLNPFSCQPSFEDHNYQHIIANPADFVVHSADPLSRQEPDLATIASEVQVRTPALVTPKDHSVSCEDVVLERGKFQHSVNPFSLPTSVEGNPSGLPFCYSSEKPVKTFYQSAPSTSSTLHDNIQREAIVSGEKTVNLSSTILSPAAVQEHKNQPGLSPAEEEATCTSSSSVPLAPSLDGIPDGNQKIKLPRPRNPLIDAVVAHDKSKLRKVSQLPQPQLGQKAEERDSLLEQIRAKSFSLKPAVVTRPSIQGPKTNIRLAAILEKANAIRQAFAGNGSDEDDDEDGWSDS